MPSRSRLLSARLVRSWLRRRPLNSHKFDFGHVLIIAGSRGMIGAGILSAQGALRSGAGLVTLAVPRSLLAVAAKKIRPEAMTLGLPETSRGSISPQAIAPLLEYIRKRRVASIVVGPGLSRHPMTAKFVKRFLLNAKSLLTLKTIVLDADGFLAFSGGKSLSKVDVPVIVTPHAGELAGFLGVSIKSVESARREIAPKFAKLFRVICVLKGHQTVISDGKKTCVNPTGNPGMARGGSGDVLSGVIAGLTLNTNPPDEAFKAACVGVYVHGLAGDLAAKHHTQISMTAGDIAENISGAFKKILP